MLKRIVSGIMLTLLFTGMLTLAFNIQPVKASGTIYIRADGSIEPSTAPISTVDNITYVFTDDIYDSIVVERDNIIVDGTGYTVQGTGLSESKGIDLSGIGNVTVRDTQIKNFGYGIVIYDSSSNSISGNNVANNEYGIYLETSERNSISGNNITANNDGISAWLSAGNSISGNNITANNGFSIDLLYSLENSISGNNVANNGGGIEIFYFDRNSISGNNITGNEYMGIWLLGSSENSISGNNVANNGYGIWLHGSYSSSIIGNNVTANSYGGIYLADSSSNSISGNNVANNDYGIWLEYSSNNIIYHNNFIDNGEQVDNLDSTNVWDNGYPSAGNYWSDYSDKYPDVVDEYHGEDQDVPGSDRIWDSAYEIDADNQDTYPLVEPWSPRKLEGDVNGDGVVDVFDLSLVGLAYGCFHWMSCYNRTADLNYDGVVDGQEAAIVTYHWGETDP